MSTFLILLVDLFPRIMPWVLVPIGRLKLALRPIRSKFVDGQRAREFLKGKE